MRISRRFEEQTESIQLAPLIDIVFLTLVFFMTTTVYGALESEIDVSLPTANSASPIERTRGEIIINVKADGAIVLNNRTLTIPELQDVLYQVAENFPGGAVIIRGDGNSALGQSIAILNCCRNADIQNVSFAAIKEDRRGAP
ncbi:MAG: biopolymer transporter ExbD [Candidatus Hydrogenedentes bacterium]|nr:biopolymer transporter ExbD [Candidatus Hydrogenedentota bacterium]